MRKFSAAVSSMSGTVIQICSGIFLFSISVAGFANTKLIATTEGTSGSPSASLIASTDSITAAPSKAKTIRNRRHAVRKTRIVRRAVITDDSAVAPVRTVRGRTRISRHVPVQKALLIDPTIGDDPTGEDMVVRQAAIGAIGSPPGSMVVVDPSTGRILSIVNQKLALQRGYEPCSTFKPAVALAALSEGVIENDNNRLQLGGKKKWYMDLEQSLAHSNNVYFAKLGSILGLDKLRQYGQSFGFGEQAGWGIVEEPAGIFPQEPPPPSHGGVGKVASFGEGISQTTLQLVSFVSAVANGGTLYYLQYPKTREAMDNFTPKVKRKLDIGPWLQPVRQGMMEAVLFGTAKRAHQPDMTILGKTGTCSEDGMKLGWFAGYNESRGGLAVAVLQRTTQPMGGGPHAAELAGHLFRRLADLNYVPTYPAKAAPVATPAAASHPVAPAAPTPPASSGEPAADIPEVPSA